MATTVTLGSLVARVGRIPITPKMLAPADLIRISRHRDSEPYFGRSRWNRWDDPLRRYGVSYLGTTLPVAFAETVLHDAIPDHGAFIVPDATLRERFAVTFDGRLLRLAPLFGAELKRLGGNNDLCAGNDYRLPRRWSRAIYLHPVEFDGLIYVSRHLNDGFAVALFERASAKITAAFSQPLTQHRHYPSILKTFHVTAV